MHSILIFLFSSLASFIGSLQLGPVNLLVINTSLKTNNKNAFFAIIGGIIPEFIYCSLAVFSGSFFLNNHTVFFVFQIILIAILMVLALVYFFKKHTAIVINPIRLQEISKPKSFIIKGFSLAILNPQLLPYWMLMLVYFNSLDFLKLRSQFDSISFIFGAGMGAFILLLLIIITIHKYKEKITKLINNQYYYKMLAVIFFLLATQQLLMIL